MYRAIRVVSAFFLVLPSASSAQGPQPSAPPSFDIRPHPKYQLLFRYPAVQEELELSPDQKAKLKAIQDELDREAKARREMAQKRADQEETVEAKQALFQELRVASVLRPVEAEPAMLKVLDRGQRARLDQIQLQSWGAWAFLVPEVRNRLNMAPDQIERIRAIVEQGKSFIPVIHQKTQDAVTKVISEGKTADPAAAEGNRKVSSKDQKAFASARATGREEMVQAHLSINRMVASVLTKKQRENYRKMLGKPFIVNGQLVPKPSGPAAKEVTKSQ
jgi:hypothetical protein